MIKEISSDIGDIDAGIPDHNHYDREIEIYKNYSKPDVWGKN
jgi:hypothetical protein